MRIEKDPAFYSLKMKYLTNIGAVQRVAEDDFAKIQKRIINK